MNRQSNTYTIIYASVLVLVVGVVLSVVYQALRPKQIENIDNDTKRQILAAARITPSEGHSIADLYAEHIKSSYIVDMAGKKTDSGVDPFKVNIGLESKKEASERLLPVFECTTDNGMKYIVPVYGAGLWGPIWGYASVDADGSTIYGAYFAHQGETPGLGAEIEKPKFSDQFQGKHLLIDGNFAPIAVVKAGMPAPEGADYVDGVSGGTITSKGVGAMIDNCLAPYGQFLTNLAANK